MADSLAAAIAECLSEHEASAGDPTGFALVTFHNGSARMTAAATDDDSKAHGFISDMADLFGISEDEPPAPAPKRRLNS